MLTTATVNSTTTDFAYDGDGTRTSKTVGSTTTPYLYDSESGLPLLVDDGSNAYLQQDGALSQTDGSGDPSYLLGDALGSVRGVTDDTGALTGSADYNAFGSVRASSGASSALGYTGEQSDPSTGLTYLRARYLNPVVGRFVSADTVSPNAPGTQGYNPYAYVANNPTTWTDPSGQSIEDPFSAVWRWFSRPEVFGLAMASVQTPQTSKLALSSIWKIMQGFYERNQWKLVSGVVGLGFAITICVLISGPPVTPGGGCLALGMRLAGVLKDAVADLPDMFPSLDPAPGPGSGTDPTTYPSTPTPKRPSPTPSGVCDVPQVGVPISSQQMKHIMDEHGPGSTATMRGYDPRNPASFEPKSRFYFGETNIRAIVELGIIVAYGKWQVTGTRCGVNRNRAVHSDRQRQG